MKETKKFWTGVLLLLLAAVIGPGILFFSVLVLSTWIKPWLILLVLIASAAVIAYRGGIGR